MWTRNLDTGKWSLQIDQLPKDYYDGLKQDMESVKLYSKCLSGAVYISIDNFDNIYNTLSVDKIGYYIDNFFANKNIPFRGPQLSLNSSNYEEFYQRYLKENAFTIKNLFTPTKLIDTEVSNFSTVDVSTTEEINDLFGFKQILVIDGIRLIEGHRVLVNNQMTRVTLPFNINVKNYFTITKPVSEYYLVDTNVTDNTYEYFNEENGIYTYTNNRLVRENDLVGYEKSYKLKVIVKYGNTNNDKEFHLKRLNNNYYPVDGENISFEEKQNWILRHRLDYNNVLELNHYDILRSSSTEVYSRVENFTYSIPERLLAVGEFGVIINNQDKLDPNLNTNNSTIIDTKYKLNLRGISETNDYYWICGDEGTLLKVYKPDLSVTRVELNIFSQLNSITFFDNLNGFVVGKFNTIFFTTDGGNSWVKLNYPEYESFSFNKVAFSNLNKVYICGTTGLFIELTRDGNSWISYKRQIFKTKDDEDFVLVDDIYDILPLNWVDVKEFIYTFDDESKDFARSLEFSIGISKDQYQTLEVNISSKYSNSDNFKLSKFYIDLTLDGSQNGLIYSDLSNSSSSYISDEYSLYQDGTTNKTVQLIDLPIDSNGNVIEDNFSLDVNVYYDYDGENDVVLTNKIITSFTINFSATKSEIVLLPSDNQIIVHDSENKLYDFGNDFIYIEFDKNLNDIRTISKPKFIDDDKVYIGSDKIYYFNLGKIKNYPVIGENHVLANLFDGPDLYVNRLVASDKLYLAGNDSLLNFIDFVSVGVDNITTLWDPFFIDKYKPRFLFLDYDIASKVNFFTDLGQYRLPQSVTIETKSLTASNSYLDVQSLSGQTSWIDYYKDGEKTFEYYTFIGEDNKVEFSTKFDFSEQSNDFSFNKNQISNNLSDILKFAPSLAGLTSSEFFEGEVPIISTTSDLSTQPLTLSDKDVLIYKNIIIFKRPFGDNIKVGDTLRLESDIVDCNLIVNKIRHYYKLSGQPFEKIDILPTSLNLGSVFEKYVYCFNTFNQNIVNNLMSNSSTFTVKNLNYYDTVDDLIEKFEKHPVSIAYKLSPSTSNITATPRFNNKTAYYNLAVNFKTIDSDNISNYSEAFLTFGFSPNYNLLDVLNKIDGSIFDQNKKFSILPEYYGFGGTTGSEFTSSNIKVVSDRFSNKLVFGEDLKFQWESLLIWTFVDLNCVNNLDEFFLNEKILIIDKYYDVEENGYVLEFHKKITYPNLEVGIKKIDIISRNTLSQISGDLQILNNIQRSSSEKTINSTYSFTQYENEVKFKFPTDSYLKVFVSDFDIQQKVTAIVYTDYEYQLAMNIINVERELEYNFDGILRSYGGLNDNKVIYSLTSSPQEEFTVGDMIKVELTGGTGSSREVNPQYQGVQTIIDIQGPFITTAVNYGVVPSGQDTGKITFIKRDKFLNYLPIDLYGVGGDKKPKRGIEITPEMVKLDKTIFSLENVNQNKYKIQFVDGLFLQEIEEKFSWFLQAETSNAIVGKNENGIVWYSGVWRCGRWFSGTWISGEWLSGDWYGGDWYSSAVKSNILSVEVSANNFDNRLSKWRGGRWFDGDWYGGSWYDGRRYGGSWYGGIWYNGVWNDGDWYGGNFQGGIWVYGNWDGGLFNCDSRLSYWLDGIFKSGDFENGIWYNGQFGNQENKLARFGTRSINTRVSIWHGGKWISGEFHSVLNIDPVTLLPTISDVHTLSIWRTGLWLGGSFFGGIAYNIDFRGGIWEGGILEEIQVIGVDAIYPELTSTNIIYVNGIFKFNPGDKIYIIDDYKGGVFSPIGNNDNPREYRINKIDEDETNSRTALYLNFNLSRLDPPVDEPTGSQDWNDIETNLRVVSHFVESYWKSGVWTNGYFENGTFESGIWYNGIFEGNWGI